MLSPVLLHLGQRVWISVEGWPGAGAGGWMRRELMDHRLLLAPTSLTK